MRWSAADAFLRPALERENLTVLTESRALRVLFEGDRATGVEISPDGSGRELARLRAEREVVLCARTYGSPQLLLLSDADLLAHARRTAQTKFHPTSTCAIGRVVDSELKVLGLLGLRVVDASVMPTSAERAEDRRHGPSRARPLVSGDRRDQRVGRPLGPDLRPARRRPADRGRRDDPGERALHLIRLRNRYLP